VADYLKENDERKKRVAEEQGLDISADVPLKGAAAKAAAKDAPKTDGWIDVSKEGWTVKLGGHVQLDYIMWPYADPAIEGAENYFSYRRLRLEASGTGYGVYDFRLQLTLEPGEGPINTSATADVKDAYLTMNEVPWLGRVRFGNFFVPFGLEEVTNDRFGVFLERSIPTQNIFTPGREVGMAIYNCTADQNLSWSTGIFFDNISDTVKTRFDRNQGYRVSGRVSWLPYYDEPSGGRYLVHTGVGALYTDDHDDRVSFRARPEVQRAPILIDTGVLDAQYYTTGNLEFAVVWGRVTLQSEAYLCQVELRDGAPLRIGGAYAHLSYFVTGENRTYERFGQHGAQFGATHPFSNFFITPGGIGPGALELKARWSNLTLGSTEGGYYNGFTFGFNWYWSDRARLMFDWIHPITSAETLFGATQSDLIGTRLDFNW
jgi:phosphate-selective porin OprO/OprP